MALLTVLFNLSGVNNWSTYEISLNYIFDKSCNG